jgi:serine/threonine protein kinase
MGEVWRAHDADTDRIVAVKLLPAHFCDNEEFQRRFRREAHAAAGLNSPHVIPIHHYGEIDGRLYVDMRLIEGRDLASVLAQGPLEPGRAVRMIKEVAKALHAAHKIGLVHRDVKPSNILLDDDFAYLIDFGLARAAGETRLTATGGVIGSWHYMSPERLRAGQVDARADIYALACVLYECLTGSTPYPGDTLEQQMSAHLWEPPPQPSSTDPNVPATFDPVIATGMAKEPDNRYTTTVELADAAHDAITTPLRRPAPAPTRPGTDLVPAARRQPTRPPIGQHVAASDAALAAALLGSASGPPRQRRAKSGLPPVGEPSTTPPVAPSRRRRESIVLSVALLTVAITAIAIVITSQQHENSNGPQIRPPSSTQHSEPTYSPQVTLSPPQATTMPSPAGSQIVSIPGLPPVTVPLLTPSSRP